MKPLDILAAIGCGVALCIGVFLLMLFIVVIVVEILGMMFVLAFHKFKSPRTNVFEYHFGATAIDSHFYL